MANIALTHRRSLNFVDRLDAWFAEWRRILRESREQGELRRKLRGVDDHLLRDMGLQWTGRHFERIGGDDWR